MLHDSWSRPANSCLAALVAGSGYTMEEEEEEEEEEDSSLCCNLPRLSAALLNDEVEIHQARRVGYLKIS